MSIPGVAGAAYTAPTDIPEPTAEALRAVTEDIARKYNILPLAIAEGKLTVAASRPVNPLALDDLRFTTKLDVQAVVADAGAIKRKIETSYARQATERAMEDAASAMGAAGGMAGVSAAQAVPAASAAGMAPPAPPGAGAGKEADGAVAGAAMAAGGESSSVQNAPAVRLANALLQDAVELNASDIHLEPFEDAVRVRYRVDGTLVEKRPIPTELYSAVSTRIKILAGMDIAEKRVPQDGRAQMPYGGEVYDFRVSSLPTVFGEKVEIRKLSRSSGAVTRDQLFFSERENKILDRAIRAPHGILLVTGPTGSGKTTMIYAMLHELNSPEKNIVTIEDPVEYMIRGINQVQVNPRAGLTFASGLRSILRQDPDILMIGEIRDEETAEIAIRAAITGHLVLSTLHTNDAPGAVARLADMGVAPYLVGEAARIVIAQRLVRVLCPQCKTERPATAAEREMLGLGTGAGAGTSAGGGKAGSAEAAVAAASPAVYEPRGCPYCNGTGYKGRRAVRELFPVEGAVKGAVARGAPPEELRGLARQAGLPTLFDNCRELVLAGVTSPQEMIGVALGT